jgi:short subunit dehydrogenase-like uncharacterized protein
MIAVYGASGHTGELVARELLARDEELLLLARDRARLESIAARLKPPTTWSAVGLDEGGRLREQLRRARAVINCAGPFSKTAHAVAQAAIDTQVPYVDITAEPPVMRELAEALGARAEQAGVALLSGAGFYFAVCDCLAGLLGEDSGPFSRIQVAYLIDDWRMTRASRETAMALMRQPRLVYESGRLSEGPVAPLVTRFDFGPPYGEQEMIAYHGGEVVTIPAHLQVDAVSVLMTKRTFGPETFSGDHIDSSERARSKFVVVVEAESEAGTQRVGLAGSDIYRVGAVTAVEAAVRLVASQDGYFRGDLAPAEVLDAVEMIRRLRQLNLVSEVMLDPLPGGREICVSSPPPAADTRAEDDMHQASGGASDAGRD